MLPNKMERRATETIRLILEIRRLTADLANITKKSKEIIPIIKIIPILLVLKNIAEIIKPYENICIRLHTDGFLMKEEPKGIKYGEKLGDLVDEGYFENIEINKSGIIKYD